MSNNYYMVSYHAGNGIYCTNLATADSVEDIQRAYANHEQVTINPAKDYEIESAKRRGMPVVECEHVEEIEPETVDTTDITQTAKKATAYADSVFDYIGSGAYICDTYAEIADNNTSIYYNDIIRYISEHVEEVNDTICEFGWDGCGSDLYKAGQMAEYNQIEGELYSAAEEIIAAYAAEYLRRQYGDTEVPRILWDAIAEELDSVDTSDRWDAITDIVDTALHDYRTANDNGEEYEEDTDREEIATA